jgi:hypothetical protein
VIITQITSDGHLNVSDELLNELIGKKIKLVYEVESEEQEKDAKDFIDLLKNGPKVEGKGVKVTREWIHDRDEDDLRYR